MASVHDSGLTLGQTYSISELQTLQQQRPLKETASTAEAATAEPSFTDQTSKESGGFVSKLYNRIFNKQEFVSSAKEIGKTVAASTEQVKGAVSKSFQKACNRILVKMGSPTSQEALKHLDAFRETGELPEGLSPGVGREILQQATRTKMKSRNLEPLKRQLETKIPFDPAASVENLVDSYALAKELGKPPEELEPLRQRVEESLIRKNKVEAGHLEIAQNILTPATLEILLTDNPDPKAALELIISFKPNSSALIGSFIPALLKGKDTPPYDHLVLLMKNSEDVLNNVLPAFPDLKDLQLHLFKHEFSEMRTNPEIVERRTQFHKAGEGALMGYLNDEPLESDPNYNPLENARAQNASDADRVDAHIYEKGKEVGQTKDMAEIAKSDPDWESALLYLGTQTAINGMMLGEQSLINEAVGKQGMSARQEKNISHITINRNAEGKIESVDVEVSCPLSLMQEADGATTTVQKDGVVIVGKFTVVMNKPEDVKEHGKFKFSSFSIDSELAAS